MRVCSRCGRTSDAPAARCPACKGALITTLDTETDGSAALAIDPSEELEPGTMVGDYQIEKLLGWGGMGIVYGATHPVIGKRAAIKVLNARYCADRESLSRFLCEAQAVNQIGHANIVDIFAIGHLEDGRSYLVMEWLQGETLMDRQQRQPLSLGETIAILVQLTRALEAAHNAGVIHRDLKPENIILLPDDDTFRVKLLDFGIAKLESNRAHTRKTATGMTVGTPLFMSPEQAKGQHGIDGRTDIYSLGVLAYSMICRRTPFEDEGSPVEVLHAHISKPPVPPRELVGEIPAAVDELILQMLSKSPDDRPALVEVRRRLKSIDNGGFETFTSETPAPNRRPPIPNAIAPPARRRRSALPILVFCLAAVAGAAVFYVVREDRAEQKPAAQLDPARPAEPAATPVDLPAEAAATMGTIELVVTPATATVTIDDKPVTIEDGRARIAVSVGDHAITSRAAGYATVARSVAVTSSEVTPVSIKLAKQPAARPRPTKAKKQPGKKPATKDVDAPVDPFKRQR